MFNPLIASVAFASFIAAPAGNAEPAHARARLVLEHASVAPGGATTIGVHFEMDPQWHIYWPGQNDSGSPTIIRWKLPEGWKVEEVQWPAPQRHLAEGEILDHVYEKSATLIARLKTPKTVKPGDKAAIAAEVEWLVCKSACIPGSAALSGEITIADAPAPGADAKLIEAARAALPKPPGDAVKLAWSGRTLRLTVDGADQLTFAPHEASAPITDLIRAGEVRRSSISLTAKADNTRPGIIGVLTVKRPTGKREHFAIDAPFPTPPDSPSPPPRPAPRKTK